MNKGLSAATLLLSTVTASAWSNTVMETDLRLLPDGSRVEVETQIILFGNDEAYFRHYDHEDNLLQEHKLDIHYDYDWLQVAPNRDFWVLSKGELGSWDSATKTFRKTSLPFNTSEGIVRTDSKLVLFDQGNKRLNVYDSKLNISDFIEADSCSVNQGYFTCSTDGTVSYIDAQTWVSHATKDPLPTRNLEYRYRIDHNDNFIVTDNNGNELFNRAVMPAFGVFFQAINENIIVLHDNWERETYFVDWQGNIVERFDSIRPTSKGLHPKGSYYYSEVNSLYKRSDARIQTGRYDDLDYLNTNNPEIINSYHIEFTPIDSTNNENPDTPDGETDNTTNVGGSAGSSGGSAGILGLMVLSFFAVNRKNKKAGQQ
ncbi:hypothetical protein Q8W40_18580 [Vibrio penaeicida]|uniref:hypothetical protein n=1 Tax=Vibrio penaeicida TaxID=104609 RepID=UPI0027355C39|nr:hypothetical protein [Vibrio penaeicida]MDP2574203.1 hypothetical protein [Vibrio penaeicida]